jgi:RNA polymerase subunit RPABC4/transcription elongation factor Spt4
MNAKKCDRCGRYYDENQFCFAGSIKYQRPGHVTDDYELCPDCCHKLQSFLKFKDTTIAFPADLK